MCDIKYHEQCIRKLEIAKNNLQNSINRIHRNIEKHEHLIDEIKAGEL